MTREFIILPEFEKSWKSMNLTDSDLRKLQYDLISNPQSGVVIKGTGGLRKMRVAFENRGKKGSMRVIYVDFTDFCKIYLITAYPKNAKDNLSDDEKKKIKILIEELFESIR